MSSNFNKFCENDPNMFRVTGKNPVIVEEQFYSDYHKYDNGIRQLRMFDLKVTAIGNGVAQVESGELEYKGTFQWETEITDSNFMRVFSCWKTKKGYSLITWWTKLRNSGLLTSKSGIPFDGNAPIPKKPKIMGGTIGRY